MFTILMYVLVKRTKSFQENKGLYTESKRNKMLYLLVG
jgi:hypothetical protein